MPFLSGAYALPSGSLATVGEVLQSAIWNSVFSDLVTGLNTLVTSNIAIVAANGLNSNLVIGIAIAAKPDYVRITGPTTSFSIGGMSVGMAGRFVTIRNATNQTMTIVDNDVNSTTVNRITTLTGGNIVLRNGAQSAANFFYDGTDQRWIVTSTN